MLMSYNKKITEFFPHRSLDGPQWRCGHNGREKTNLASDGYWNLIIKVVDGHYSERNCQYIFHMSIAW